MRRPRRPAAAGGFTLLEVLMAGAILSMVIGLVGAMLVEGGRHTASLSAAMHAEVLAQATLHELSLDLMESSPGQVSVYELLDPAFPEGAQAAIAFTSARDPAGAFQLRNGRPVWQALVVYCPFWHPGDGGQLRRYVSYGDHAFPVTIAEVDAEAIVLSDGTVLARAEGEAVLTDVAFFRAGQGPPVELALSVMTRVGSAGVRRTVQMASTGRSKN